MGYKQVVMTTAVMIAATAAMQAQRRVPGSPAETKVPVTVALKAGADSYNFTGNATCSHAPVAAIYNLRAERWTVEQSEGSRSLTLALWHPASGSDLVSLNLSSGTTRHSLSTIKVGNSGTVEGAGTITLAREGKGGTFTINATAGDGTKISGSVKCGAFTAAIAEGGN